jgi:hypothetical protein
MSSGMKVTMGKYTISSSTVGYTYIFLLSLLCGFDELKGTSLVKVALNVLLSKVLECTVASNCTYEQNYSNNRMTSSRF